jgi:prephenate dehydratase
MDAEGHIAQARVGEALAAMKRLCADVRFLGSYPAADTTPTKERPGTKDADFTSAHMWVAALRAGTAHTE